MKTPSKHDNGPECLLAALQAYFLRDLSSISEKYTVISFPSKDLPPIMLDSAQIHSLKPIYTWPTILAAFHKGQVRFLEIIAMKWYHQKEKDQRNSPFPKLNQLQITFLLQRVSVSDQTWPYQQLQNRHDHEAYVTGWLSYCGTLRHWQLTSQLFLHLLTPTSLMRCCH